MNIPLSSKRIKSTDVLNDILSALSKEDKRKTLLFVSEVKSVEQCQLFICLHSLPDRILYSNKNHQNICTHMDILHFILTKLFIQYKLYLKQILNWN